MKRTALLLNDNLLSMLDRMILEDGCTNQSEAIRKCIAQYHKTRFPAYAEPKAPREPMTPKEIAERAEAVKQARLETARIAQVNIMQKLNGRFKAGTENDEDPVVEWTTYFMQQEMEQSMSLSMLTEDLVGSLYQPSLERVNNARKSAGLEPLQ